VHSWITTFLNILEDNLVARSGNKISVIDVGIHQHRAVKEPILSPTIQANLLNELLTRAAGLYFVESFRVAINDLFPARIVSVHE